jgi:hypothetical protein
MSGLPDLYSCTAEMPVRNSAVYGHDGTSEMWDLCKFALMSWLRSEANLKGTNKREDPLKVQKKY